MEKKQITIVYEEYGSSDELEECDRRLLNEAIDARCGAYAPYSHFKVGAAVRLSGGVVVKGSNQENAAYPSGLCAERTTMFAASAQHPEVPFEAIAIVCGWEDGLLPAPGYPCGACLQVMAQYERKSGKPLRIIIGSAGKIQVFSGVSSLMPFIFSDL